MSAFLWWGSMGYTSMVGVLGKGSGGNLGLGLLLRGLPLGRAVLGLVAGRDVVGLALAGEIVVVHLVAPVWSCRWLALRSWSIPWPHGSE